MNENKRVVWLYAFLTTIIAVIATVFRSILEKYYIEAETGMYKLGVQTPEAFNIFLIIGVIILLASMFLFDIDSMKKDIKGIPVVTALVSMAIAAVLIFSSVSFFMAKSSVQFLGSTSQTVYKIRNIGAIAAFPAALYYFMLVFSGNKKSKALSVMSFFPLIWSWIYLLGVYFDHSAQMSSPVRILTELSLIFLLLYQLMESRALAGKAIPLFYLLISGLAFMFLCPAFLPNIIVWAKESREFNINVLYTLYGGVVALYIFTRIIGYAMSYNVKKERKPRKNDIFTEEDENIVEQEQPVVTDVIEQVEEQAEVAEETDEEVFEEQTVEEPEIADEANEEITEEVSEEAEDIKFFEDEE